MFGLSTQGIFKTI